MCGIAGIIDPRAERLRPRVVEMIACLAHRGPDDEGVYEAAPVCLGHRRLAIIDLTQEGHQPMVDGARALVFNGEIYNHQELRQELSNQGVRFRSRSDTEVLLRGYAFWGDEIVVRLKGMFAFALWDGGRQRLFCGRDPFGKKPFYYSWGNGTFVFASEIEAVVRGLETRPEIDISGLPHYLLKGYFPPGRSVYGSIDTLRAGHCLAIEARRGEMRQWPYWREKFVLGRNPSISRPEAIAAVEAGLRTAVQRRFESDVPVGVLLSGGVDSSLISLVAAEDLPEPARTYTATFKGTAMDESSFAAQVALRARSQHTEFDVSMADVPALLPRLVEAYGEPFGDYSAIPTYCLFEGLKPFVKVVLTGDGGDEIFCGYKDVQLFWWRRVLGLCCGASEVVNRETLESLLYSRMRKVRELGYLLMALRRDGAATFQSLYSSGWTSYWRSRWMRPEAWRDTGEDAVEHADARLFHEAGRTDLERFLNRYLERLTQGFLVKIDRAAMAHSIEARCPLLDVDIFELASGLPGAVLFHKGEQKGILKELLARRMGRQFAGRTKMGFMPPLEDWFRQEETCRWLEKLLTDKASLAYYLFPPEKIRQLITLHRQGQNHVDRLWNLLFLNEWQRHYWGKSPNPVHHSEID